MGLIKQLIAAQLVVEETADIFVFRHALMRQAVEADLLARERRALHRAIAGAMERLYAGAVEAHLADLAEHCYAAGLWEQAQAYARRAGEQAQAIYAPRAAVEQFTRALDAARRLAHDPPHGLYRARGQMYEVLGEFDAACEDYTQALQTARGANDRMAEWQSLLDLGFLWTGRDYARANEYLQGALRLARDMGEPSTLAHSLNRVGNWLGNIEQPLEGRRCHQEALALFQGLNDRRGLAMTLDLLGTTSLMGGDILSSARYYEQAIALFRELDDRQGLIFSLANYLMRGAAYVLDTVVCQTTSLAACLRDAEEARQLARQIGWRAGEAFVCMYMGLGLGPRGDYARALEAVHACLAIAAEIEHHHWLMAAHWTLGALYLDLLALADARQQLEQALRLAEQVGHLFSIRMTSSFLAETCIAQGDIARAQSLLDTVIGSDAPMQTIATRRVWCARAKLALARGDPEATLQIVDQLIASAEHAEQSTAIPQLWYLRGEALIRLRQLAEAEIALQVALAAAQAQGERSALWRIHASQGKLLLSEHRRDPAAAALAAAQSLIAELAADLPDQALRAAFLQGASAQIPQLTPPTPRRAAKQAFGGLTERERQVAALVAQGKSNREIGDELVVSERTVEKHVENVLSKLSFTSRAQIAAWAVEKGLNHEEAKVKGKR
jgi:DNA-binding NarL/FixJ family response regulator